MTIIDVAEKFRTELEGLQREASSKLLDSYGQVWRNISTRSEMLAQEVAAQGGKFTPNQLYLNQRYQALNQQIESEILRHVVSTDLGIQESNAAMIDAAMHHAKALTKEAAPQGTVGSFVGFSPRAVESMLGALDDGSPLHDSINALPKNAQELFKNRMIEGMVRGENPVQLTRGIRDALGSSLSQALTISRTEMLRAYREGTRAVYQANSNVVQGWRWLSSQSSRTCAMCWAMDGMFFPLDEPLGSHPNCRCTMIPVTQSTKELPTGPERFEALGDKEKFAVLGPTKFDLYKSGKLQLRDLVAMKESEKWGTVRHEKSLSQWALEKFNFSKAETRIKTVVEPGVAKALKAGMDTQSLHNRLGPKGDLWSKERTKVHERLVESVMRANKDVPHNGQAIMSGGLGGAGKSTVLGKYMGIDEKKFVTINPDNVKELMIKKGLVPDYQKQFGITKGEAAALIHDESSKVAKMIAERAMSEKRNVMFDVTMGGRGGVVKRLDQLEMAGYNKPKLIFVDIPVETSVQRANERYMRGHADFTVGKGSGGRYVPNDLIRSHADSEWGSKNRANFESVKDRASDWIVWDNSVFGRPPIKISQG